MDLITTLPDRKISVYLAGPIHGRNDKDCHDWRNKVTVSLQDVDCFNPMVRDYRGREHEEGVEVEIVENDKADIDVADIVLVYFDHPSVGTSMEIFYAWSQFKYVLLVNASGRDVISPWLTYHTNKIVDTLEEAIDHIQTIVDESKALRPGEISEDMI